MKTSWPDVRHIDDYLHGHLSDTDATVFEACLILDPALAQKVKEQQAVYRYITLYGRKTLKAELENTFRHMQAEPEHRSLFQKIHGLFKP